MVLDKYEYILSTGRAHNLSQLWPGGMRKGLDSDEYSDSYTDLVE